jgi:hypothetical protein
MVPGGQIAAPDGCRGRELDPPRTSSEYPMEITRLAPMVLVMGVKIAAPRRMSGAGI